MSLADIIKAELISHPVAIAGAAAIYAVTSIIAPYAAPIYALGSAIVGYAALHQIVWSKYSKPDSAANKQNI